MTSLADGKVDVRRRVWEPLLKVARPDSRHHFDFSSFIADFEGSAQAVERLTQLPSYIQSTIIFITPDNCLEDLRLQGLKDGKSILVTTYAIRRGFWLLDPKRIAPADYRYAAMLDGMERLGQPVTIADIVSHGWRIPLMVTGTGAINLRGVRFGKGHGFFDLEWAMLYSLGVVDQNTVTVGVVHDCQVLEEELYPDEFDTVCDVVVTPTRVVEVEGAAKPTCGILWPLLQPGMLEGIPPLQELKDLNIEIA
ncbi:Methenyltetrahydrofolate synthase domain-containing [Hyphodiscus hymeniophilus]|uniref:Methenyltetrahydrofolate synthase domain-containing n=1 Tax=Hyphodiscus hymeniophilus TaxID=353542 RepID=A0A9P7AVQ7_9HELO|nr:Methenyltetrahydrofolate synthase domain-containing [Hyphodiscus hymeniophilus]